VVVTAVGDGPGNNLPTGRATRLHHKDSFSGIPVKITGYPWKRALSLGREGKVAIGGIYQNLTRMAPFDYSDPIYRKTLCV